MDHTYTLGIDIGSTTVKVAVLDADKHLLFSDYERHFANPVIHKQDLQHEELLACYPERWAQLVKDIMEGKQ